MKRNYLLLITVVFLLINSPTYGYLLENIPQGTGNGYLSVDVGQGASSNEIRIGTDQWATSGDQDRNVNALGREDAVLLFTVGSTTDATWLSDPSAWTVTSETGSSSQYTTTMTRTVGSATVTVKSTTTLGAAPNTTINEKYEISVAGDVLSNVKLFAYNDFSLDLGTGDRAYPVGDPLNPSGDTQDYSLVTGTPGSGLTLIAYDSYVSSGGVPAPPPGQVDVSIGMREKGSVSPTRWEVNEFSTLSDKLNDLVANISTDLNLLNSDVTGGALKDTEFAFQYNLGELREGTATVEYDKVVNPVPEPATLLLVGMGLLGLGVLKRNK